VVTGAGRGIGRAIATELADAGATVAVVARTTAEVELAAEELRGLGHSAVAFTADVRDQASVGAMVDAVRLELGEIDIFVNNAGTNTAIGPVWDVDPEDWWLDFETNVKGVFLCTRAVLPAMLERGKGRVINISSGAASEPRAYSSGYCAAKTAAQRFSESVQLSLAGTGVFAFSLNPGPVLTPMNIRNRSSEASKKYFPQHATMNYLPAEKAASYVLVLASGRGDALAGRYVQVFDDIEALIAEGPEIVAGDLLRLAVRPVKQTVP
jgi:NAD(P)-dependent dehydrogenase (short-subunit alcohol dehydrogenase family)